MRKAFIIFVLFMALGKLFSTAQTPDYLIQDQDTVPIFNNPLEQYFDQVGNRNLIGFINPCGSTGCWRNYLAYWELKNDSLFLRKVTTCVKDCDEAKDADLHAMFGKSRPFAAWYSGTLTIPKGERFRRSDIGYTAIYEYEEKLEIVNGKLKQRYEVSNIDLIADLKLNSKLYELIPSLRDTLLYYLKTHCDSIRFIKTASCFNNSYVLSYDKDGQLNDVEFIKYASIWRMVKNRRLAKTCPQAIKLALKPLSLSYLEINRNFKIYISLDYDEQLKIVCCKNYKKPIFEQ